MDQEPFERRKIKAEQRLRQMVLHGAVDFSRSGAQEFLSKC